MAEPSAGVMAGTAVVGMTTASLIPGVDVNAVVGAFAGAMFFVVFAKDLSALSRLGYFIASWVAGYYVASEVVGRNLAATSGLVAFFGALFCVAICISLLEWVQGGKTPGWLRFIADRFGGRPNG
ncbi:putative holin [Pseudomonas sp. CMR5c]|uniref:putative holin n=1 Tax=Pseudomonas sp. CMR5c TaxID=658630 RepID=UPI00069D2942|nr:putative holin [Pseudomonas sp. CMR5c]AZC19556.1 Phage holin [Pseudomonas sp. CMR5c]